MYKQPINSLRQLKLQKSESKALIHNQEVQLVADFKKLNDELFSLDSFELELSGIKALKGRVVPYVSKVISTYMVNEWLKPTSKLVRKVTLFSGAFVVQKLIEAAGKKVIKRLLKLKV